jgi:hypothetical protein
MLHNDDIWWCNSDEGCVMKAGVIQYKFDGFVRGLYFGTGIMVVGVSHHKYNGSGKAGVHIKLNRSKKWKSYALPDDVDNVFQVIAI